MFPGSWLVPRWRGRGSPRLKARVQPGAQGRWEASIALVAFGESFAHPQILFQLHVLKAREKFWGRRHVRGRANITLQNLTKTLEPCKNPPTLKKTLQPYKKPSILQNLFNPPKPLKPTKTLQPYKNPSTLQNSYNATEDGG